MRIFLLSSALLPLVIAGVAAAFEWRDAWEDARRDLARTADATAEYAERVLGAHRLAGELVNQMLAGLTDAEIRAREAEIHERLRRLVPSVPMALTIALSDRDAILLVTANIHPVPPLLIADREWVRVLRRADAPAVHVSGIKTGRLAGNLFFGVSLRRQGTGNGLPEDAFDGVVNLLVSPVQLAAGLAAITREEEDVLGLIRDDGEVLARYPAITARPPRIDAESPLRAAAEAGEARGLYVGAMALGWPPRSASTEPRLVAFRRVGELPIYATAARSRGTILAAWRAKVWGQLAVALPATAVLGGLALLVLRGQRRLARSEADFRGAFERTSIGMVQADPGTCRILRVNDRFCTIADRARPVLLDGPTLLDLAHPEDREANAAAFAAAITAHQEYVTETRLLRPDASAVWVRVNIAPIQGGDGAPARITAAVQDITERKAVEAQQALLVREVDHRAKNTLAVVQAILTLTRADDTKRFVQAVMGRVAALARAHTLLAEARWQSADLHALVAEEVAPFRGAGTGPARVVTEGSGVSLAPSAAQPLAMALHELLTNATKHGALSSAEGQVRLSWRIDPDSGALCLDWEERGGPPATPPTRRSFGTSLLEATVRRQLGGELDLRWEPTGLRASIRLPSGQVQPTRRGVLQTA